MTEGHRKGSVNPTPLRKGSVNPTPSRRGSVNPTPPRNRDRRLPTQEGPNLIGVIQAGTSTVSFFIYSAPDFQEITKHRIELKTISPQDGWFEQDPIELINSVHICCEKACSRLPDLGYSIDSIITVGITNQRETTVVWDANTGKPLHNAILWKDIRTSVTVDQVLAKVPEENKDYFKNMAGLPISPYFSALKIRWLKDNVPAVRKACREKHCKAGTIDSWILWNLTDGKHHLTDVTNASRTLLMNIETLNWDPILLKTFSIHIDMLPEIRSNSEMYGTITNKRSVLKNANISAVVGNQHASLLGQMCLKPGQAKNTYRDGCFLLCNTGKQRVISTHGLLTTVAYKLGPDTPANYALEGAVAVGGYALQWLQNKVRIMPDEADAEQMASAVATTGGVYFVPAFTGLFAPYWRKDARGTMCGISQYTTKNHIIRAAFESVCYQTRDILECMYMEGGFELRKLHCDGELSTSDLMMQLQADIAGVPVLRAQYTDCAGFGTAMCAAAADGINLSRFDPEKRHYDEIDHDTFLPTSSDEERKVRYGKWKQAVERSLGWVVKKRANMMSDERYRLLSSIPVGLFIIGAFAMLVHSKART